MTITSYILLALCALANGKYLHRRTLDGRIVGGIDADIQDYPYQLSLMFYGTHMCGASIISNKWALTAAHCVDGIQTKWFSVRAGSNSMTSGGTIHPIKTIIMHEKYNPFYSDYDFALLKVDPPFNFEANTRAIELATDEPNAGTVAEVSGWGATAEGGSAVPNLQVVAVPIVDRSSCNTAYGYNSITERMICAGYEDGGKDACEGDSGGPLVAGGKLVGVVSFGRGCAMPRYPGVYSNVASQRNWIIQHTDL